MTDAAQNALPGGDKQLIDTETPFQRFRSEFLESRTATIALGVMGVIVFLAVIAPWIVPQNPYDLAQVDVLDARLAPGSEAFTGYTMWLGSDGAGRDLYSAILYGLRMSLSVGVPAGFIALLFGVVLALAPASALICGAFPLAAEIRPSLRPISFIRGAGTVRFGRFFWRARSATCWTSSRKLASGPPSR